MMDTVTVMETDFCDPVVVYVVTVDMYGHTSCVVGWVVDDYAHLL